MHRRLFLHSLPPKWALSIAVAVAASLGASLAAAQPVLRSFAVLSELAREVSVVTAPDPASGATGTTVARLPIPEGALDKAVLVTARQAIEKVEPGASAWLIAPLDSDLFGPMRNNLVEGATLKLPEDITAEMAKRRISHLLFVTRLRGEAALDTGQQKLGSGTLEGLGFYLDRNSTALPDSQGFLAPYIYARVLLIDARNGRVLRARGLRTGSVLGNPRSSTGTAGNPWDLLSPAAKVQRLSDMIVEELGELMPEVLAR